MLSVLCRLDIVYSQPYSHNNASSFLYCTFYLWLHLFVDLQYADSEPEVREQTSGISSILQFFTGNKQAQEPQMNKNNKSLKTLLRSLELNSTDKDSSAKVNQLIKYIEDGSFQQKKKKKNKSNLRENGNVIEAKSKKRKLDDATVKKVGGSVEKEMMSMLKEQKVLLTNFQTEINQLRTDIVSQASECGDSTISCHKLCATPCKNSVAGYKRAIVTPSRTQYKQYCPGTMPSQFKVFKQVPCTMKTMTPLRHKNMEYYRAEDFDGDKRYADCQHGHKTFEVVNERQKEMEVGDESYYDAYSDLLVKSNTGDEQQDKHGQFLNGVDNLQFNHDEERPALNDRSMNEKATYVSSNHPDNEEMFIPMTGPQNRININKTWRKMPDNFKQPSVIEKVQRWRQSVKQPNTEEEHTFKVPIVTPMMKRRRISDGRAKPSPCQAQERVYENSTPTNTIDFQRRYPKDLRDAPKKLLPTKRRRPLSPDEGYVDASLTPELKVNHWERTKRTLNFERFLSQRRIGFNENTIVQNEEKILSLEKCSTSSGFVDSTGNCSSKLDQQVSNEELQNQVMVELEVDKCLGCHPFSRFPLLAINSRNTATVLKNDHFTCDFHSMLIVKNKSWFKLAVNKKSKLEKGPSKMMSFRSLSGKYIMPKESVLQKQDQWESMSVFSYRSDSRKNDDDARSEYSVCTFY